MAYYPPQGSHYSQPVVYASSSGHYPTQYASSGDYYGQHSNPGVIYVPSHSSRRSRHGRHHHTPQVVTGVPPIVMQPSTHYHSGHHHYHIPFGERIRRFFGLAPRGPFKYRSSKGFWGFLGYSRRPRYANPSTGAEVDRKGRPIYRV